MCKSECKIYIFKVYVYYQKPFTSLRVLLYDEAEVAITIVSNIFFNDLFKASYVVFCQTAEDSIGHTICKIAKDQSAANIVVGQRGLGTIRRTLLGSVSDYVIYHSHIPCIVIPPNLKKKKKK